MQSCLFCSSQNMPLLTFPELQMRSALLQHPVLVPNRVKNLPQVLSYILKEKKKFLLIITGITIRNPTMRCQFYSTPTPVFSSANAFPVHKNNVHLATIISKAVEILKNNGLIKGQARAMKLQSCTTRGSTFLPIPLQPLLGNLVVLLGGILIAAAFLGYEIIRYNGVIHIVQSTLLKNLRWEPHNRSHDSVIFNELHNDWPETVACEHTVKSVR